MAQQVQASLAANASNATVAPLSYSIPLNFFNASLIDFNKTYGAAASGADTANTTFLGNRRLMAAGTATGQTGYETIHGPRCEPCDPSPSSGLGIDSRTAANAATLPYPSSQILSP